jgi:hypothetical protein
MAASTERPLQYPDDASLGFPSGMMSDQGIGQDCGYDVNAGPDPRNVDRIDCESCVGACCLKDTVLPLTEAEAEGLYMAGTEMRKLSKSDYRGGRPDRGKKFYLLKTDCGNLDPDTRQCNGYETRPAACREFKTGGFLCRETRKSIGIVALGMPSMRRAS